MVKDSASGQLVDASWEQALFSVVDKVGALSVNSFSGILRILQILYIMLASLA